MIKNLLNSVFTQTVFLSTLSIFCINVAHSQSVGVNTVSPETSASLDVFGTDKGLLIPLVELTSKIDGVTIALPATGLAVWNTSLNQVEFPLGPGLYHNTGTKNSPIWAKDVSEIDVAGTAWLLTGNAGTNDAVNFMGTTDDQNVVFKRNNIVALEIKPGGALLATGDLNTGVTPTLPNGYGMMWIPKKQSFRAGVVSGPQWDDANIGAASIAVGDDVMASGATSVAMGKSSRAMKYQSIAMGFEAVSNGVGAISMGIQTNASGQGAVAMGLNTAATGSASSAFGANNVASGDQATAIGSSTKAKGIRSFSAGNSTEANGDQSTAMGTGSKANGQGSIAFGNFTIAAGDNATALGDKSEANGVSSFAVGNGAKSQTPNSIAMGVNTTAGGQSAVAIGNATTASADYSFALGTSTTASGIKAIALGESTIASGANATAIGLSSTAAGSVSTAIGTSTIAEGNNSFTAGNGTQTKGFSAVVLGTYNELNNSEQPAVIDPLDRIFVVGNGASNQNRKNAFVIQREGRVGVNTNFPNALLGLKGKTVLANDPWSKHIKMYDEVSALDYGSIIYDTTANGGKSGIKFYNSRSNDNFSFYNSANSLLMFLNNGGSLETKANVKANGNLEVIGTSTIGINGTPIKNIIKATVSISAPQTFNSGASYDNIVDVPNAKLGSTVHVSPSADFPVGVVIAFARVSSLGKVKIRLTNASPGVVAGGFSINTYVVVTE